MNPELVNSIIAAVNKSSNCLIVLPPNPVGDSIASGLALRSFLRKLEKEVTVVSPGTMDSKFSFLEGFEQITDSLVITKSFVIEVSTKRTAVDELSYKKEGERVLISLKPKSGEFQPTDVTFNTANFPFDLIFTIGLTGLDHLGDLYNKNAELFFQVPVVNIDYHPQNESYGQYNLIELSNNSTAEIVMDVISQYEASMIDQTIATALLAGIITETNSFQHTRTTPQTFLKASQLVTNGANQQEIITHLYRSKSLGFLKLWGRALARLKQDNQLGLVHTAITLSDLEKAQASEQDLEKIVPEMGLQLKMAKTLLLLVEQSPAQTQVVCQLPPTLNPTLIFGGYQSKVIAPNTAKFTVDAPLPEAEAKILEIIRSELARLTA